MSVSAYGQPFGCATFAGHTFIFRTVGFLPVGNYTVEVTAQGFKGFKQTGLPLKSRIVNENGGVVSMFVFSELQIGKPPEDRVFANDMAGKRILSASLDKPAAVAWNVKPPPGYVRVQEAVRALPGKKSPVTHLVYSDGLSVLSLFIEPTDLQAQSLRGLSAEGTIGIYARNVEGYTVTTLGEVPNAALIETGNSVGRK